MNIESLPERQSLPSRRDFLKTVTAGIIASSTSVTKLFGEEPVEAKRPEPAVAAKSDATPVSTITENTESEEKPLNPLSLEEGTVIPLGKKVQYSFIVDLENGEKEDVTLEMWHNKEGDRVFVDGVEYETTVKVLFLNLDMTTEKVVVGKNGELHAHGFANFHNKRHAGKQIITPERVKQMYLDLQKGGEHALTILDAKNKERQGRMFKARPNDLIVEDARSDEDKTQEIDILVPPPVDLKESLPE